MAANKEQRVVDLVEATLLAAGRVCINIHGTGMGAMNGYPDIITCDANGTLVGIECKAVGKRPVYTQLVCAVKFIQSGAKYVVAYPDFTLEALDNDLFGEVTIPSDPYELAGYQLQTDARHCLSLVVVGSRLN